MNPVSFISVFFGFPVNTVNWGCGKCSRNGQRVALLYGHLIRQQVKAPVKVKGHKATEINMGHICPIYTVGVVLDH